MTTKTMLINCLALIAKADRLSAGTPLSRWHRLMSRNNYTIDPTRPNPSPEDEAAARAIAKAEKLWERAGNWKKGQAPIMTKEAVQRMLNRQ